MAESSTPEIPLKKVLVNWGKGLGKKVTKFESQKRVMSLTQKFLRSTTKIF